MGFVAGGLPIFERVPGEDRRRVAEFDYAAPVSITTAIIVLAVITVLVLLDRPRITLDPQAITLQRVRDRLRIPWAELLPGGPSRRGSRPYPDTFALYRVKAGAPVPLKLPVERLHVDSAFLAHTIRYYLDDPGRRSAIGTEAGLTALRSSFQSPQGGPAESSTS